MNRKKIIKALKQHCEGSLFDRCGECPLYEPCSGDGFVCRDKLLVLAYNELSNSVHQNVVDQIKWERDIALEQLAKIGKGLGEKMDDIVTLLEKNEAHVMTIDEIHNMDVADTCYIEWLIDDKEGIRGGLEIGVVDTELDLHSSGSYDYVRHVKPVWTDEFKERYWSSEPTKEQMKSTPWKKMEDYE